MDLSADNTDRLVPKTEAAHAVDLATPTAIAINEADLGPEEVHKFGLALKRFHVNAGNPSPLELARAFRDAGYPHELLRMLIH